MCSKITRFISSVVLVLAVTYVVYYVQKSRARIPNHPILSCPEFIDLGERELGETAIGYFQISNHGSEELTIDNISTSCSCSGLEQVINGKIQKISSLKIQPKGSVDVQVRLAVGGIAIGSRGFTTLWFKTNDPNVPDGSIEILIPKVKGGVHAQPNPVVVGTAIVGDQVQRTFEIRDDAITPRKIRSITSSDPELVQLDFQPCDPAIENEKHPNGRLIGMVHLKIMTKVPRDLSACLSIHLEGDHRPPDTVKVIGSIVRPLEISPKTVVLPRRSRDQWLYHGTCICRSTNSKPFRLSLNEKKDNIKITFEPEARPVHVVQVELSDQTKIKPGQSEKLINIDLIATYESGELQQVQLPIQITSESE